MSEKLLRKAMLAIKDSGINQVYLEGTASIYGPDYCQCVFCGETTVEDEKKQVKNPILKHKAECVYLDAEEYLNN